VNTLKGYPNNVNILKKAAWAIRNMSVRNRLESDDFVAYGAEELLRSALRRHGSILDDHVKAALRDLGLQVDLKERWTGKGVSLNNEHS